MSIQQQQTLPYFAPTMEVENTVPLSKFHVFQERHATEPTPDCSPPEQIFTSTIELKTNHPIMLARMGVDAESGLAAAVANAGAIGVIGSHGISLEGVTQSSMNSNPSWL
ncbi:hypothetical protein FE257_005942 [Aspergillus nanangensis]|uniref:Uncharacterized protein n=1 Tax=Aspergillus nanangensis TaxID=2582783 RepID=A0AAD4CRS2_ASPNN|nr:hypothetical protein FE257_005942 [Aspergillus nanangensis]